MNEASQIERPQSQEADQDGDARECVSPAELLTLLRRLASFTELMPQGLDSLLTLNQCARWMQISVKELSERARRRLIPSIRTGGRKRPTFRFHPRTILEQTQFGVKK